jgi:hypothetical protein
MGDMAIEAHLRQPNRRLVLVQNAHLVCERVTNDQSQRIERRHNEQPVGPVELRTEPDDARVDARSHEKVREDQKDPFRDLLYHGFVREVLKIIAGRVAQQRKLDGSRTITSFPSILCTILSY